MTQFCDGRLSRQEAAELACEYKGEPTMKGDLSEILDWLDDKAPTQAHKAERNRLREWLKYGTYTVTSARAPLNLDEGDGSGPVEGEKG